MYLCIHTCIHVCIHTCTCAYLHTSTYMPICGRTLLWYGIPMVQAVSSLQILLFTGISQQIGIPDYMFVLVRVCVCVCV